MPLILNGTTGVTFDDSSLQGAAASPFGLKNRIINGDMVIDQRNNGASVTPTDGQFSADRWKNGLTQSSKYSIRVMNGVETAASNYEAGAAPVGFSNSIKVTSLSAYTSGVNDEFEVFQNIEANNLSDLNWGTANARTVTLSFWVKSSLTGTFGGAVTNGPTINYSFPFSYTILAANTWEYKTVTIIGPTAGTFNQSGTNVGLQLFFSFGGGSNVLGTANSWVASSLRGVTGQVNLVATNSATLYITGVQLERNTTATPFEWIPYTTELQLCQRYYWASSDARMSGYQGASNDLNQQVITFPVAMRSGPSVFVSTAIYPADNNITSISAQNITTTTFTITTNKNTGGGYFYSRFTIVGANEL